MAQDGTLYLSMEGLLSLDSANGGINWRYPIPYHRYDGDLPLRFRGTNATGIGLDGTVYLSRFVSFGHLDFISVLYAIKGDSPMAEGGWPTYRGNQRRTGQWLASSAQPFSLEASVSAENMTLQSTGFPLAEYTLQSSVNLSDWERIGTVTGAETIQLPKNQTLAFFRLIKE